MDWLTFAASIGATLATILAGWFGFQHQIKQERTKQAEIDAAGRRADVAHHAATEAAMWQRVQAELDRINKALDREREAREGLQAELETERAARQALAERVRHLEAENARLKSENEELRAGVRLRKL
jgi:predicted nuclease with TOPRIM domain